MKKATVATLLKIPSLSRAYLAAGSGGIARRIERLDILEHPFPEVDEYLEKNEFMFTSFWNSKDSKELRISLVKALISHGCSGIGIMPGLHLNKIVDSEIIALGNKHDFPVLVLDEDCRWSDIIREFYQHTLSIRASAVPHQTYQLLSLVDQYKADGNLLRLGVGLERLLQQRMILCNGGEFYISNQVDNKILSKIQAIFTGQSYELYTTIRPYISQTVQVDCIMGKNSYISLVTRGSSPAPDTGALFCDIGVYLLQLFDDQNLSDAQPQVDAQYLSDSDHYYFFYLKSANIVHFLMNKSDDYLIYDYNKLQNYAVGLWRCSTRPTESVFSACARLAQAAAPICLIFSDSRIRGRDISRTAKYVISQMEPLVISGIFTVSELPILNLLNNAPMTTKARIIDHANRFINTSAKAIYQDTFRLFLVFRSITRVAELFDVHTNTVKYRISKTVKTDWEEDFSTVPEHHTIESLIALENLKLNGQPGV